MVPLIIAGAGLGLLVSQLNNYTLSPHLRRARERGRGRQLRRRLLGLSFGLAFAGAIMLATLSIAFTQQANNSTVLPPDAQEEVAQALEDDAEVMSNTRWRSCSADEPPEMQAEIIRINTDVRPLALQVALLIPIIAALLSLLNGFRMMREGRTPSHRAPPTWRSPDHGASRASRAAPRWMADLAPAGQDRGAGERDGPGRVPPHTSPRRTPA